MGHQLGNQRIGTHKMIGAKVDHYRTLHLAKQFREKPIRAVSNASGPRCPG